MIFSLQATGKSKLAKCPTLFIFHYFYLHTSNAITKHKHERFLQKKGLNEWEIQEKTLNNINRINMGISVKALMEIKAGNIRPKEKKHSGFNLKEINTGGVGA